MALTVRVKYNFQDILSLNKSIPQIRYSGYAIIACAMLMFSMGIASFLPGHDSSKFPLIGFWSLIMILLGIVFPYISAVGGWSRTRRGDQTLQFSEDYVTRAVETTVEKFHWNHLGTLINSPTILALPIKGTSGYIIAPRRVLSDDQARSLEALLQSKAAG